MLPNFLIFLNNFAHSLLTFSVLLFSGKPPQLLRYCLFQQVRALKQMMRDTDATTVTEINQGISTGNFIDIFLWIVNFNVINVHFQQNKVLGQYTVK